MSNSHDDLIYVIRDRFHTTYHVFMIKDTLKTQVSQIIFASSPPSREPFLQDLTSCI